MGQLVGPGIVASNRVTAFINGDRIFPAMLEAVRRARKSIDLETYIYWSGNIGGQFAEALHLNALVTLLLPFAAASGILYYSRLLQRRPLRWPRPPHGIIYTVLTLTAIFTIIRNLPLSSF